MPKLDKYDSVQESTASEFAQMEPGAYMCRVQAVRTSGEAADGTPWTSADKKYVAVVVDVDEGEHAGKFSDAYWAEEAKDYGHRFYMSWKESALGMLKHTMRSFAECNPGFDPRAAFEADAWEHFVGKRVLVQWNGREYESNQGDVRISVRPDRAITADDAVRPKVELLDGTKVDYCDYAGSKAQPQAEAPAAHEPVTSYDDIPF